MSLKALDELREWSHHYDNQWLMGNGEYVEVYTFENVPGAPAGAIKNIGEAYRELADRIEAEIAERFMELPVDADGVPIHVGDKMEYIATDPFVVCAVAPGVIHAWAETKLGEGKTTVDYPPVQCHHFKPRTIEDVLHEFAKRVLNSGHQWGLDAEETTANYADEIRELMGGGE